METIIYQGQSIQAEKVNQMSGRLCIAELDEYRIDHEGDEELLRDAAGHFYLHRRLEIIDVDGATERRASGRTHLHRVSLTAAAQWAAMRANAYTHDLRRDLRKALKVLTSTTTRQFTDGSMAVTLHLKPAVADLVRKACEIDGCSPVMEAYDGLRNEVRAALEHRRLRDAEIVAIFEDNAPDEDAPAAGHLLRLLNPDGTTWGEAELPAAQWVEIDARVQECGGDVQRAVHDLLYRGLMAVREQAAKREISQARTHTAPRPKKSRAQAPTDGHRHRDHQPTDVALLAAGEPELVEDDTPLAGEDSPRVELDGEQMPDYEADSQDGKEGQ